jgi:hypothetical protein
MAQGDIPPATEDRVVAAEKEEKVFSAPEPEPFEPGRFDSNGVMRCRKIPETRIASLLTLARLWIPDAQQWEEIFGELSAPVTKEKLIEVFEPYGLTPISWSTNLAMVRAIDLPVMAEVYEGALFVPQYIAVIGLDEGRLIAADPLEGLTSMDEQEFGRKWFGRLTVLVPKSVRPEAILGPGSQGEEVRLLQGRLKRLGFFDAQPSGYFGGYTEQQVRRFQQKNYIKIDGLVGLETNLVLFSRLAGVDAPRLASLGEVKTSG